MNYKESKRALKWHSSLIYVKTFSLVHDFQTIKYLNCLSRFKLFFLRKFYFKIIKGPYILEKSITKKIENQTSQAIQVKFINKYASVQI